MCVVSSNKLSEVEYVILKEWFDFLVASQDIKVDLFGMFCLYLFLTSDTNHRCFMLLDVCCILDIVGSFIVLYRTTLLM